MSETELIERLKREENKAFQEVIESCYPAIRKFVLQGSGEVHDVDDVVQETLIVLVKSLRKGQFRGDSKLTTYVIGIARNIWMHTRNKAPNTSEMDQYALKSVYSMEGEALVEKEIEEARLKLIEQGLNAISEECQKVLQAYYYKKQSLSEIADDMQYTYAFAKVKKFRCLQSLRNLIEAAAQHVKP